jgi:hypothetical protein
MVSDTTEFAADIKISFDDLTVLSEVGFDVFIFNWNEFSSPPPYYVTVEGRRFGFTAQTVLFQGHGALLAGLIAEHEAEGRTVLLVERDDRYLMYVHDAAAEAAEAEEEASDDADSSDSAE